MVFGGGRRGHGDDSSVVFVGICVDGRRGGIMPI